MITLILSWLLHHANRNVYWLKNYFVKPFYDIKTKICKEYGVLVDYDLQFFEGKECWSCDGTGIFRRGLYKENCYKCMGTGWYVDPMYVLLEKYKLGNYFFHRPLHRKFAQKNPFSNIVDKPTINGTIYHDRSKYAKFCFLILFLIYNRSIAKEYVKFLLNDSTWRLRNRTKEKLNRIKRLKRSDLILHKPHFPDLHWLKANGEWVNTELPF